MGKRGMKGALPLQDDARAGAVDGVFTTPEMVSLTGVSRWQLEGYVRKGIVSPYRASASPQADLRWTADQLHLVHCVAQLQQAGHGLSGIAVLVEEGMDAVNREFRRTSAQKMRDNYRNVLNATARINEMQDISLVGAEEGLYVRYIPQRYLALAYVPGAYGAIDFDQHAGAVANLLAVADVVGWNVTTAIGSVVSMSADGRQSSSYVSAMVTGRPVPWVSEESCTGSGCYCVADPSWGGCYARGKPVKPAR